MAEGFLGGVGDFFFNTGRYADPNAINPQYGVPEADVRQAGINTLANVSALLLAAGQPMSGQQRAQLLAGVGPALGGMQRDIQQSLQARRAGELFPLQRRQLQQSISGQELQQQMLQQQIAQQQAERESRQRMVQQLFGGQPLPPPPVVGGAAAPGGMPAMPPSVSPATPAPAAPAAAQPAAAPAAPGVPGLPPGSVLSSLPPDVLRTLLSDPSVKVADIYKKAMEAQTSSEKEAFDRATKIRSEFDKVATPFNDRQTAYRTMIDLAQNKQGASDMSLVLSIMKIYDPTSTVTGGEAANAQNAAGVPSFIVGYYNRLVGGGILSDTARNELVRAGETRFEQEMDKFEGDLTRYTGLATRNKVPVEDVVTDFRDPELKQARQMKKDFDLAARRLTVDEISQLPVEILSKLNPSLMSRSVADAYKKRVDELTRVGVAPAAPAAAQPALPELSYGMGQNPLGRAMQQYPGGLLRAPQLPTPQF
jgi:hypothetical protein